MLDLHKHKQTQQCITVKYTEHSVQTTL